jgi:hypothetical protein
VNGALGRSLFDQLCANFGSNVSDENELIRLLKFDYIVLFIENTCLLMGESEFQEKSFNLM